MGTMNVAILGDGGWGTTLAIHLARKGYPIELWGPFPAYIRRMAKNRYNTKFLPGVHLPRNISVTENLTEALESANLIVFAIPSKYATGILKAIKKTKVNLSGKIFYYSLSSFLMNLHILYLILEWLLQHQQALHCYIPLSYQPFPGLCQPFPCG